jgi:hypothetical protein
MGGVIVLLMMTTVSLGYDFPYARLSFFYLILLFSTYLLSLLSHGERLRGIC